MKEEDDEKDEEEKKDEGKDLRGKMKNKTKDIKKSNCFFFCFVLFCFAFFWGGGILIVS